MKINKDELKKIIQEEIENLFNESRSIGRPEPGSGRSDRQEKGRSSAYRDASDVHTRIMDRAADEKTAGLQRFKTRGRIGSYIKANPGDVKDGVRDPLNPWGDQPMGSGGDATLSDYETGRVRTARSNRELAADQRMAKDNALAKYRERELDENLVNEVSPMVGRLIGTPDEKENRYQQRYRREKGRSSTSPSMARSMASSAASPARAASLSSLKRLKDAADSIAGPKRGMPRFKTRGDRDAYVLKQQAERNKITPGRPATKMQPDHRGQQVYIAKHGRKNFGAPRGRTLGPDAFMSAAGPEGDQFVRRSLPTEPEKLYSGTLDEVELNETDLFEQVPDQAEPLKQLPLEIKLLEKVIFDDMTAEEAKEQLPEEMHQAFDYFLQKSMELRQQEDEPEEVPGLEESIYDINEADLFEVDTSKELDEIQGWYEPHV